MKKQDLEKLKEKDLKALKSELGSVQKELFSLRIDKSTCKLKDLRSIYHKRKDVTVIKTVIREKELKNENTNR